MLSQKNQAVDIGRLLQISQVRMMCEYVGVIKGFKRIGNLWYIANTCKVLKAQVTIFGHKKGRAK